VKATLARRLFTADDYEELGRAGILGEDERVELIGGEIIALSPIGGPHMACVNTITEELVVMVGRVGIVSVQNPIRLGDRDEPQPDIAVLTRRRYGGTIPIPGDVRLVIEVSDTTQHYDRTVKLPRYATAGIPEAWIVDLQAHTLERHSEPGPSGYGAVARVGRGGSLPSLVLPSITFIADELLESGEAV
jgi:Uma2 family endonuclease